MAVPIALKNGPMMPMVARIARVAAPSFGHVAPICRNG
jgi:hypothetical protein